VAPNDLSPLITPLRRVNLCRLVGVSQLRGKAHSSHGGRKAYLNFELKDLRRPEAAALRAVLDFEVQMRSMSATR
jgi:hypothetical protein